MALWEKLNNLPVGGSHYDEGAYVFISGRFEIVKHEVERQGIVVLGGDGIWSVRRESELKYDITNGFPLALGAPFNDVLALYVDIENRWSFQKTPSGVDVAIADIANSKNCIRLYGDIVPFS